MLYYRKIIGSVNGDDYTRSKAQLTFSDIILDCLEEIDGQKANGYYVFTSPTEFVPLPFPGQNEGKSFHHGRFVMNLRRAVLNHPK